MLISKRLTEQERAAIEVAQAERPTRLSVLAKKLGLEVKVASLPPGISGEIRKTTRNSYLIRVNRDEPLVRQRFSLAHEIAHFLLHRHAIGDGIIEDKLYRSARINNVQEVEANRLAAEILMPAKWIDGSNLDDSELAEELKVSEQAMRIRRGGKGGL